jgi:chromosome segregation ATPase
MRNLLRDIDQAHAQRKFSEKPLLVGQHVKLGNEHMSWALAVEIQCGNLMGQFVVNNGPDRVQFWKLKNKYRTFRGGQAECYISRKQPKHHVHQVDQNLLTVERVLQVSNDWVYNLLVDKAKIETVTLFEDEGEAERRVFLGRAGQRTMPNGVTSARLPNGVVKSIRHGMEGRTGGPRSLRGLFGTDVSGQIADHEKRMQGARREIDQFQRDLGERQQRLAQLKQKAKAFENKKRTAQRMIHKLQDDLQELQDDEGDALTQATQVSGLQVQ